MTISTRKYALVSLILFLHISVLDLFFVTLSGPVFLVDENLRSVTIFTHLTIALTSVLVCFLVQRLRTVYKSGKLKMRNNVLMLCSMMLALSIYLILFT
ncbi:MAG: hypothetical protein ACSHW0_03710 [Thalassotalea sp.]